MDNLPISLQQLLYASVHSVRMFFKEAKTHMVWNVQIVIGQPDTVPAHLVDQVFSDNDDLLGAVLDPDRKNKAVRARTVRYFKMSRNQSKTFSKTYKSTLSTPQP